MHKLVKYVGIGLLVVGLAACDNKDSKTSATDAPTASRASGQPVELLDGKLSFTLPAGMSDKSDKVKKPSSNTHVYADATSQKAVIVMINDNTTDNLVTQAKRMEQQQRSYDPELHVVMNKTIEIKGHPLQRLDSIISAKGQTAYSSILIGHLDDKVMIMQITLPADNQQLAQTNAENIINTLVIK